MDRHRAWILLLVLAAAIALRIIFALASMPVDDAYITYRYARNIAGGSGFVYNPGERTLGTTTPLFTLLLAPFTRTAIPLEGTSMALSILFDVAVVVLLERWLRRACGPATGMIAALIYAGLATAISACGHGMETQMFTLLALAALYAGANGRTDVAAAAAGLASLTRPEGYLLSLLLAAVWIARRVASRGEPGVRLRWRTGIIYLAIVAPWTVFATLYFGSPLPQSLVAKASHEGAGLAEWAAFFFRRNPIVAVLWLACAAGALEALFRRSFGLLLLAAWGCLYTIFFAVSDPPFYGIWYFGPVVPMLAGLGARGAVWIASAVVRRQPLAAWAAALVCAAGMGVLLPHTFHTVQRTRAVFRQVYGPMAHWVAQNTGPDELIEVADIGYVGWVSNRRILDASGLVSPGLTRFYREHREDRQRDLRYTLAMRPEIFILSVRHDSYTRFVTGGWLEHYTPVARFQLQGHTDLYPQEDPGLAYGSGAFVPDFIAYRRRPQSAAGPPGGTSKAAASRKSAGS